MFKKLENCLGFRNFQISKYTHPKPGCQNTLISNRADTYDLEVTSYGSFFWTCVLSRTRDLRSSIEFSTCGVLLDMGEEGILDFTFLGWRFPICDSSKKAHGSLESGWEAVISGAQKSVGRHMVAQCSGFWAWWFLSVMSEL